MLLPNLGILAGISPSPFSLRALNFFEWAVEKGKKMVP